MALITEKPRELKPENALDDIPADLLGPIPAEIRLGQAVLTMLEKPPGMREVLTLCLRLKVKRVAIDEGGEEGGEDVHFRGVKIVAAWVQGDSEPPDADAPQPGLFDDEEDEPTDEPERLGDIVAGVDLNGVDRPGFSDVSDA